MQSASCALVLLLATASCATSDAHPLDPYPELKQALVEFKQQQAEFNQRLELPKNYDFPGAGRVSVRQLSLDGYPGNTYVRCRFTYQNTTGKPVMHATVSLDVLNAAGKVVARQSSVCIVPVPVPLAEGSMFSDELRTRTLDAHLQPGWSWRITCKPQFEEPEWEPAAGTGR
jgi:hypothetical protein